MGLLTANLHRLSSTLSWVQAQLPKAPQLFSDRFADPHEVDPLVASTGTMRRDYCWVSAPSTKRSPSGQAESAGNSAMS